ncbi:CoB--CoM heterodisulfide reductase iron-sulfur subunit A family protein [uncultured Cetobacterium sp.]|uniref:CoB--CoM heterodisulfide reductase iron-sulfur subunit A family protein n=1 Tax=uncultured Cetobacterium sp. TaxID=527638 RepID=UPI00260B9624|nr:CoB--CoM heterodisulfide reductase iron-sulfur subunit A family protein [uncultured Cetobacterium sp.]
MRRIGVYVCWCGSNIAGTVDVERVRDAVKDMPGVVHSVDYQYMCSEVGQNFLKDAIKEKKLDRIVVAACSPRMHEATFRKAAESAGLNPYLVEIANIREHCSWVHKDKEIGTEKAIALTKAAIAKATLNEELISGTTQVEKRALVVGGGIAGIQTALDIADAGYKVDLVEQSPSIGGKMAQIDKTFPTLDCSACILTPKMVDAAAHENITVHTYSEIESVTGFVGNFNVAIKKKPRYVDMDKCTGCGICIEKCPSKKGKSEFEEGLTNRTAIYTPFAQSVPKVPVIDKNQCIKFKIGKCGVCSIVCGTKAIDFEQKDMIINEKYGAIVLATGFDLINLDKFGEYSYPHPDVITSLEFERLTNAAGPTSGKFIRFSDGKRPKKLVFIQCVGSRDKSERGKSYCSKVCCMYTAKHAMLIKDKYPDTEISVFYIDIRTPGKNFDEFHRRAVEEYGVNYIKGTVGKVIPDGEKLMVQGVDLLAGIPIEIDADMVVLATATCAKPDAVTLKRKLNISGDLNNFFTEAHPKLKPVETASAGIYLAGACQGPKDIPETVAQASAAAAKAIILLSKKELTNNACISKVNENKCSGCKACSKMCPYDAISMEMVDIYDHGNVVRKQVAKVNEALCQGCGGCTVSCRPGAIDLKGYTNKQIMAEVDTICL